MKNAILLTYFTAEAIAPLITTHYNLPTVRCRLLTNSLRDVYLVESEGDKFVFYFYRHGWRTRPQIQSEWELMAAIGDSDEILRVPQPIPTQDEQKNWILPINAPEGERFGVLATYAEGVSLRVRISPDIVHQYGQAIGKLHHLWTNTNIPSVVNAVRVRPSHAPLLLLENAQSYVRHALDHDPILLQELENAFDDIKERVARLTPTSPAYGLVHGDVMRHNALIAEDGTLTLLDFDFCGVGWRLYDIGSMIFSLRGKPDDDDHIAAFIEGYSRHRNLSAEEKSLIPLFEVVRILFDAGLMAQLAPIWGYHHCWNELQASAVQLRNALPLL